MPQVEIEEELPVETQARETRSIHEPAPRKKTLSRWLTIFAVLALGAAAAYWWSQTWGFESTDDAEIEGHLNSVSARISGTVTYINPNVEDNHLVQAGSLLVELDPRDYEAELEHAKANIDTRRAEANAARVTVPIVNAS